MKKAGYVTSFIFGILFVLLGLYGMITLSDSPLFFWANVIAGSPILLGAVLKKWNERIPAAFVVGAIILLVWFLGHLHFKVPEQFFGDSITTVIISITWLVISHRWDKQVKEEELEATRA